MAVAFEKIEEALADFAAFHGVQRLETVSKKHQ
jgi:hypothetical protein